MEDKLDFTRKLILTAIGAGVSSIYFKYLYGSNNLTKVYEITVTHEELFDRRAFVEDISKVEETLPDMSLLRVDIKEISEDLYILKFVYGRFKSGRVRTDSALRNIN
jgi:hypothetical protein